jgi:uncharacterized protein YceK
LILSGCATGVVRNHDLNDMASGSDRGRKVYPATQMDGSWIGWSVHEKNPLLFLGTIIDFPFSIITDTVLLPYDLTMKIID